MPLSIGQWKLRARNFPCFLFSREEAYECSACVQRFKFSVYSASQQIADILLFCEFSSSRTSHVLRNWKKEKPRKNKAVHNSHSGHLAYSFIFRKRRRFFNNLLLCAFSLWLDDNAKVQRSNLFRLGFSSGAVKNLSPRLGAVEQINQNRFASLHKNGDKNINKIKRRASYKYS